MDDHQFHQLLKRLGLSWAGYRKVRKGVKKRISRHMKQLGCRNMEAYLTRMESNGNVRQECDQLMTVSISRFFRDRSLWESLQNEILPNLANNQNETFRVWSAGCACGEEVYSFKIVWEHLNKHVGSSPALEITATDMNPVYLDRARTGIYSSSSLKEVREDFRTTYFEPGPGRNRYAVKSSIKTDIIWKLHQLHDDPPEADYHIIFLRNNLLTYYQDHLKKPAFKRVLDRLRPFGFLIIGSQENLPFETPELVSFLNYSYVFKKATALLEDA
ncbi:CheR family methyltransferase [Thermodesulfobacteriota bacterium]